MVYPKVSGLSG